MRSLFSVAALAASAYSLPVYVYLTVWQDPVQQAKDAIAAGATHIVLGWWLWNASQGGYPYDAAAQLLQDGGNSDTAFAGYIDQIKAAGAQKVIYTTGGEAVGDGWLTSDPTDYATKFCTKAKAWHFDGIDWDLEGIAPGFGQNTKVSDWISTAVTACKSVFPEAVITSAPQPQYQEATWSVGPIWTDMAPMDHYLIQYYNQARTAEQTEDGIFVKEFGSSIKELMDKYPTAPKDTFVVGKYILSTDGGNGAVDFDSLHTWGCNANKNYGWTGGFMLWQMHQNQEPASYQESITAIKALAAKCEGESDSTTTPPPPTTTTTPAPLTMSHGGNADTTWPVGCPTWETQAPKPQTTWPAGCPTWDPKDYE